MPAEVSEIAGEGLSGFIDKRRVVVGNLGFVATRVNATASDDRTDIGPGEMQVVVAVDGHEAGRIVLADRLREHTAALLADLRAYGIRRIILATGDRWEVAKAVATDIDLDAIEADLSPNDKVGIVRAARLHGPVMMIGDGINDSPALAAADVGVAMGPRGSAGSIETADMVLLADRLDSVVGAIAIAKRSRSIALQSVFIGIGLSTLGMLAAAFGFLAPIQGAVLQEGIDMAVIFNALRALRDA
jgi:P-type E1-E2 ATPase